ncbi:hypothetical protein BT93_A0833 [Corymbia citriodora subsp. variegata]|nr:hypothetical protein BT93_A0833 [Corymbia citriodora subsp. variegata]
MYPALLSSEARLPRVRRRPMKQQVKVRIMLPMSLRCDTCGNHIRQGTKFNSRKEEVVGETYLGIQRFRFYFDCTKCSAVLTIKAYPQNPDCVVESGATRVTEADEMGHVMKPLQNSTSDSKRELDILPAHVEIKSVKKGKFSQEYLDKPTDSLSKD